MKRLLSCLIFALMACPGPAPAEPPPTNAEKSNNVDDLFKAFSDAADCSQQAEVARKIVALGDKAVISKLQSSLGSADRRKRCNAGLVLAGLGDPRGLATIIAELRD